MSDFITSSSAISVKDGSWLDGIRGNGASAWNSYRFPTRKTENWKYTNLASLAKSDVFSVTPQHKKVDALPLIENIDATRLVFVNGKYDASLSQTKMQEGLSIVQFSEANEAQQELINTHLNSIVDIEKHGFAALNTQCLLEGVFVHIEKNVLVDSPIYVVNYLTQHEVEVAVSPRLLIVSELGSSVKVIEHFSSDALPQTCFNNAVTELLVKENARVEYYQLLEQEENCHHIGSVHARLEKSANLSSFFLSFGTLLTRVDISVTYAGESAESEINGVYLPQGKQHVDFHTCVEHAVPHCQTNEVFRGIIADEARAVFDGRIHIHRDAQKTEAYLSNKNLLTSNKAETVSQLEPLSVHYLKTRGISEEEALVMLSFGFINELLESVKLTQIAEYCRPKLATRFARDPSLMRHLL